MSTDIRCAAPKCRKRVAVTGARCAEHVVPAVTTPEAGRGELSGGDVQPLPRSARPKRGPSTRGGNRHAQRTPLPPRERYGSDADGEVPRVTLTEQRCAGACGRTLPLSAFPTFKRAAGTVRGETCRGCRRAAGETNYGPKVLTA